MARLVNTGIKSEPEKPIASHHCRSAIAKWITAIQQRPDYQPIRAEELALNSPACAYGCDTCFMGCAIADKQLAWWRNELALAEAFEADAIRQDGSPLALAGRTGR